MIDRMQLTHTFEVGARIQLRLYYRKPAVDGFYLLFQLAIDLLQRPNAESESLHDSFVRKLLPVLPILTYRSRRDSTKAHNPVPEQLCSVKPGRRYFRTRSHAAKVELRFFRLHGYNRCRRAQHRILATTPATALQAFGIPNHDESPVL